uniref:Uncharacterized protein n=1 Tax=Oryza barthii TaxID=65489 RepID=A0A0D3HI58_9ORYZ
MGNKRRGLLGGFLPRPVFPISLLRQEVRLRRFRRRRGGCNRVRAGIVSSPSEGSSASASHILYRVGPFDYQLAVACKSRTKAASLVGACDFFAWFEGPTSSFIKELLLKMAG